MEEKVEFTLNWNDLINTRQKDYEPGFSISKCSAEEQGTSIELIDLKRKTNFDPDSLSDNISNLFNLFKDDFKVLIYHNDDEPIEINHKLKYSSIDKEFEWDYSSLMDKIAIDYEYKDKINGKIISAVKPLKPGWRGIALYANGRMVNSAEFFGVSESSHGFSYLTGWLEVDFIDNFEEDVIATNRQFLNWENSKVEELRFFLKSLMSLIEREWREKRKEKRKKDISEQTELDIENWYLKLPDEIRSRIEPIVNTIVDNSELPLEDQSSTIQNLYNLVPEYPNYHWRHIHEEIKKVSKKYYASKDYYTAFLEALKRYVKEVKDKSGSINSSDRSMMGEVFSNRKLSVTKKYKKTNGTSFSQDTIKNIEEGQHFLSEGIVIGGRHPLSHEEHIELNNTGLFSEKDCLDFLSLLSHLFKRLNDAEVN